MHNISTSENLQTERPTIDIKKGNTSFLFLALSVRTYFDERYSLDFVNNEVVQIIEIQSFCFPEFIIDNDREPITIIFDGCKIEFNDYDFESSINQQGIETIAFRVFGKIRNC